VGSPVFPCFLKLNMLFISSSLEKGKPAERPGRKGTGPRQTDPG